MQTMGGRRFVGNLPIIFTVLGMAGPVAVKAKAG